MCVVDRNRVTFGIRLPVSGPAASAEAITRVAREAEALGFESVWAHDLTGWTREMQRSSVYCGSAEMTDRDPNPVMFETLSVLSYVAGVTSTVRIGSAVICVPLRNPVLLAKQLASIDVLSGGRLIVGVGIGAVTDEVTDYEVLGVSRKNRYERMDEYLDMMTTVWSSPKPYYEGRFVDLPATEIFPKPVQDPLPLWMGGSGPRAREIMTTRATGWIPSWLDIDGYRDLVPDIARRLDTKGRSINDFVVAKDCYVAIDESADGARKSSRRTTERLLNRLSGPGRERRCRSMLIGEPHGVSDQIRSFVEAGVSHFELKFIYHSESHLSQQMGLFARDILGTNQRLRRKSFPAARPPTATIPPAGANLC
ncbi:MAG TPA: TIGR03619 family F420-dependent LLM class oxidoreductase [Acidimicrobiia bacterium]|nr:TIGR03619 family F420-dependent LLM class oxidoreductase [Acidimicrobiia bacterium]